MRLFSLIRDAHRASFGGQDLDAARRVLQALSGRAADLAALEFERKTDLLQGPPQTWPCLMSLLADESYLEKQEPGTLARAYLEWKRARGVSHGPASQMVPKGNESFAQERDFEYDPWTEPPTGEKPDTARRWGIRRWGSAHDLYHVLTGYDIDARGEAILGIWTAGTTPHDFGNLLFGLGSLVADHSLAWIRELWRAYWWGRSLRGNFITSPWERYLELPLERVYLALGMARPEEVHPNGIERGPFFGAERYGYKTRF